MDIFFFSSNIQNQVSVFFRGDFGTENVDHKVEPKTAEEGETAQPAAEATPPADDAAAKEAADKEAAEKEAAEKAQKEAEAKADKDLATLAMQSNLAKMLGK